MNRITSKRIFTKYVIIKSGINLSNREIVICRGGAMVELVKITHENLEMEHICCAIANNKDR